jgi:flavin reductase (DIM6/NTAB) family NADH-FMN oxidoreductase RutF
MNPKRQTIPPGDFIARPTHLWAEQWLLLTAGDLSAKQFNPMTVAWGSFGTMWGRPFAQIVVRPQRHTLKFLERNPGFTLCAFGEEYREALNLCGSVSGATVDKIRESGLTPLATSVGAPGYEEAELIVECVKIYRQRIDPAGFVDKEIGKNYDKKDYHHIFFGEIKAVSGVSKYVAGKSKG